MTLPPVLGTQTSLPLHPAQLPFCFPSGFKQSVR